MIAAAAQYTPAEIGLGIVGYLIAVVFYFWFTEDLFGRNKRDRD